MELTRGLACSRLSATVVAENSARLAWQLMQVSALSGLAALHLEQVRIMYSGNFASILPRLKAKRLV
jgi:hypothetical protein